MREWHDMNFVFWKLNFNDQALVIHIGDNVFFRFDRLHNLFSGVFVCCFSSNEFLMLHKWNAEFLFVLDPPLINKQEICARNL